MKREKIPGKWAMQCTTLGTRKKVDFSSYKVPVLEAKNGILFITDLHLGLRHFKGASYKRLLILKETLKKHPKAQVVMGGDLLEYSFNKMKHIRRLMVQRKPRNRLEELWLEMIDTLTDRGAILLPGNHDPIDWYQRGKWSEVIPWPVERFLLVKAGKKKILLTHGQEIYEDFDKLIFRGIRNMGVWLIKLFHLFDVKAVKYGGITFLEGRYSLINRFIESQIDSWKACFGADAVLMGHIHLPWVNEKKKFYISGFFMEHFRSYGLISPKGKVSIHPASVHFDEYLQHETKEA